MEWLETSTRRTIAIAREMHLILAVRKIDPPALPPSHADPRLKKVGIAEEPFLATPAVD